MVLLHHLRRPYVPQPDRLLKGLTLLLDYERFQGWVAGMLSKDRGRAVVLIDVAVGAVGLVIVSLAVVVY